MNLGTIRTEVKARGHEEVSSTFLDSWINQSYQDIADRYPWPDLVTSITETDGTVTVADLGHVLEVTNNTTVTKMQYIDWRDLTDTDPALTDTGEPMFWYIPDAATPVVTIYPLKAHSITVKYAKIPTDLVGDSDTPLLPTRFHWLLVQGACMLSAQRDRSLDLAAEYEARYEAGIMRMAAAEFDPNYDTPRFLSHGINPNSTDW